MVKIKQVKPKPKSRIPHHAPPPRTTRTSPHHHHPPPPTVKNTPPRTTTTHHPHHHAPAHTITIHHHQQSSQVMQKSRIPWSTQTSRKEMICPGLAALSTISTTASLKLALLYLQSRI